MSHTTSHAEKEDSLTNPAVHLGTDMDMDMDTFLSPTTPRAASAHIVDFTTTTPPIAKYGPLFAAVIEDLFTEDECRLLVRHAEASTISSDISSSSSSNKNNNNDDGGDGKPTWGRAMINAGGQQVLVTSERNCGRIILDDTVLADKLLQRMRPFLRDFGIEQIEDRPLVAGLAGRGKRYELTRLNERLRFLKYEGGEYFRPHEDASYSTRDRTEKSFFTIHLYLNGDGEQDLDELRRESNARSPVFSRMHGSLPGENEGVNADTHGKLLGGATSFIPRFEEEDTTQVRVFPRAGSVLVFQQKGLLHGGDPVFRGVKYTMRTDMMYRQT